MKRFISTLILQFWMKGFEGDFKIIITNAFSTLKLND